MRFTNRVRRAARYGAALLVAAACVGMATSSARADLIGFTTDANTGDLFRINFGTGAATRVGATGLTPDAALADLATSIDGTRIYGISQIGTNIYSVDPNTGAVTLVNGQNTDDFYSGLGFRPDGTAVATNFDTTTTVSRVNVTSSGPATTIQGGTDSPFVDAMAVESQNSILVVRRGTNGVSTELLQRIDLLTGGVTTIGNTGLANDVYTSREGNVTGIDFFNGSLYGINLRGDLFRFDTGTGVATLLFSQVAGAGRGFQGLTGNVIGSAVPEPSSLALIAVGLACVGADRLRRGRRRPESAAR